MTTTTIEALAYYARHQCALFPIPAGQKSPIGIVDSFATDWSLDPERWQTWYDTHQCNFGLVAGPSRLIVVDIDTKGDRDDAWRQWCDLCTSWGIPVLHPHVQTQSGGWHVLFRVPDDVDATTLRQRDAIKHRINTRTANGFVVCAGSIYNDQPYLLLTDAAPYPAPAALLAHCAPSAPRASGAAVIGSLDKSEVETLIKWMTERDAFAAYEDWCGAGMALKLEFGEDGLDVWALTHNETVTPDVIESKWRSFATEPTADSVTIASLLKRARQMGWQGKVRPTSSSMFGDVVKQLADQSGATLQAGAIPMTGLQQELTEQCEPTILDFLAVTNDLPHSPTLQDFPTLPDTMAGHGLYPLLQDVIRRTFVLSEQKSWKPTRIIGSMVALGLVHRETLDAVGRRIETMGLSFPWSKIKLGMVNRQESVERKFIEQAEWILDRNGLPESDNSDNVSVLLGVLDIELRWNAWIERMEIRGWEYRKWTCVDDTAIAKLRTRANRTKTRFRPSKEFFLDALLSIAHNNLVDPALDRLNELAAGWDGTPRLIIWLSRACGVPCEPYFQAVGRNIIGGMVRRIRHPGCKHDTMAVLYGFQGSGKSTLGQILAIESAWFSDSIMFGDQSKELIQLLAGRTLVEISEMGMRGSANANHVKAMISRQVDSGRTAYARTPTDRPRRNIFIGTTNENEPLSDPTGNRRFLPVPVNQEIDLQWLRENVDQLIGEAAVLESRGDDFAIPREVWAVAAQYQDRARSASDAEIMFNEWFGEGNTDQVTYITAADLQWLCKNINGRGVSTGLRGQLMRKLNFQHAQPWIAGERKSVWFRGNCQVADIPKIGARYIPSQDPLRGMRVVLRS